VGQNRPEGRRFPPRWPGDDQGGREATGAGLLVLERGDPARRGGVTAPAPRPVPHYEGSPGEAGERLARGTACRPRQEQANQGFDISHFAIDWEAKRVTCPQGKTSVLWKPGHDSWGNEVIHAEFARRECLACPSRALCTRATTEGREMTFTTPGKLLCGPGRVQRRVGLGRCSFQGATRGRGASGPAPATRSRRPPAVPGKSLRQVTLRRWPDRPALPPGSRTCRTAAARTSAR
jgi:hypothetical protein